MQNTNTGKTERRLCANSADHHQQISPPSAGFFVPAGTLSNRELVRDIGIKDTRTPPFQVQPDRTTPHSVPHERLPVKTFLLTAGPIGPPKKFFTKNPLTGPLSSHTLPRRVEWSLDYEDAGARD